jgi:hypothetical protein
MFPQPITPSPNRSILPSLNDEVRMMKDERKTAFSRQLSAISQTNLVFADS